MPVMSPEIPMPVKAGDPAPDLTWTRIIASTASGGPQSLIGQVTVLVFLPLVSHNEQTLAIWNRLVEEFADQPVNFVWIANEAEESLVPFLQNHPVRGWMVLDPAQESCRSYGVEVAGDVLIDPHGKIAGFTFMTPDRNQIQAVLDGRAIAVQGDPTEDQMDAFFEGKAVRLDAQPFRSPPPPQRPDYPPSDEVHISLSTVEGTIGSTAPDHWMQRGFDLRAILSMILGTAPSRIETPPALDNGARYDIALVPPRLQDEETMNRQLREGIEKYFHVTIAPEIRPADVYVMTAVEGKTPPAKSADDSLVSGCAVAFSTDWEPFTFPEGSAPTRKAVEEAFRHAMENPEFRSRMAAAESKARIAVSSSMDEFSRALEDGLHRPVIDETGLAGIYDFQIQGDPRSTQEFLDMLRDQLGIVLTPTRRNIEMIVVRPVE
jgi:uncharacterized protein (TIGR03435 family)